MRESQRNLIEYGGGLEIVSRGGSPPGGAIVIPGLAPIPVGKNFVTSERRFFGPRGSFAYTLHNLRGRAEGLTRFHSWMTSAVHGEFWKHFFRPLMHRKVTS